MNVAFSLAVWLGCTPHWTPHGLNYYFVRNRPTELLCHECEKAPEVVLCNRQTNDNRFYRQKFVWKLKVPRGDE